MTTLHVTIGSGKMSGIHSINTSTISNTFCGKMQKTDSVCSKCYASRYENMRPTLHNALIRNDKVLSESILPVQELPVFNDLFIRANSFGELINATHLKNLANIARKNPNTLVTLWTKRKDLIRSVFSTFEKPENLQIIYSSPVINKQSKRPMFFDKVFTVYDKKTAINNDIEINCGSKSCTSCRICYTKNDIVNVRELLK